MSGLTRENVRAFMNRDWDAARRIKDARVGNHVRRGGATAAFRLAQLLLDQVWDRVRNEKREVRGLLSLEEKLSRARA